ncbi:Hypothetical predicted protein, partial [Pelobates cultripes]
KFKHTCWFISFLSTMNTLRVLNEPGEWSTGCFSNGKVARRQKFDEVAFILCPLLKGSKGCVMCCVACGKMT